MKSNKLDTSKMFENYVTGKIPTSNGYAAIITDIEVIIPIL